jgi:hypothetical protein
MNMKTASAISKPGVEPHETSPADRRRAVAQRRRERREFYRLLAPPDVRHRKREARRWLDEKAVRITNPRFCDRRPDEPLLSMEQRQAVADALYDALRRDDPELLNAVYRLLFEDSTREYGITLEEWKRRSVCRSERVARVRAEMRRAGLV